jgi:predicted nucleic acid-binding protein
VSGFTFDSNIIIDFFEDRGSAKQEIARAIQHPGGAWISRMVWIEVMSKGDKSTIRATEAYLTNFGLDEITSDIAAQAAQLRRERPRLKSPDAVVLATAQLRNRILVTRNTRDFSPGTPGIRVPYTI